MPSVHSLFVIKSYILQPISPTLSHSRISRRLLTLCFAFVSAVAIFVISPTSIILPPTLRLCMSSLPRLLSRPSWLPVLLRVMLSPNPSSVAGERPVYCHRANCLILLSSSCDYPGGSMSRFREPSFSLQPHKPTRKSPTVSFVYRSPIPPTRSRRRR